MSGKVKLAFCIDESYARHMAAAIVSVYLHNYINKPEIYIVSSGLAEETIRRLRKIESTFGGCLIFKNIPPTAFAGYKELPHISRAMYYRLMLPDLLDLEDKVIYLDADMVIEADLTPLWNMDIQEALVAGTKETSPEQLARLEQANDIYINSGVLVMDLSAWRRENVTRRCVEWLQENPDALLPDQDAINMVLYGKKAVVEDCWNLNPVPMQTLDVLGKYPQRIIHFGGPIKPWHKCYSFTLQAIYRQYVNLTEWCDNFTLVEPVNIAQACLVAHQYFDEGDYKNACEYYELAIEFALMYYEIDSRLLLDCLKGARIHSNAREHLRACEHYRSCLEHWGYPSHYMVDMYKMPAIFQSMEFRRE